MKAFPVIFIFNKQNIAAKIQPSTTTDEGVAKVNHYFDQNFF